VKYHLNVPLKTAIVFSRRSQQRIAALAGMNPTHLSHVVAGRRAATPEQQVALAAVLGRMIADLFPVKGA